MQFSNRAHYQFLISLFPVQQPVYERRLENGDFGGRYPDFLPAETCGKVVQFDLVSSGRVLALAAGGIYQVKREGDPKYTDEGEENQSGSAAILA